MAERARRVALRREEKDANIEAAKAKKRDEMTGLDQVNEDTAGSPGGDGTGPDGTAM